MCLMRTCDVNRLGCFFCSLLENKEKEDSLLGEKRFIDERVTELENSIKVRMPAVCNVSIVLR